MLTFREFFYLITEGQAENQALAILNNNQELLNQIKQVTPEPKYLPIIAYFHAKENINLNQLTRDIQSYKRLVDRKNLPMMQINKKGAFLDNQIVNYLTWTEKIHAVEGQINFQNRDNSNDAKPIDGKPIFSKNNIDIYEAHGRDKCIQYGNGYSFCISQIRNTMWQSYRDLQSSTFYFVFDRNRTKQDPLHIVVVDHTKDGFLLTDATNNTGKIAEFGDDSESYLKHLESKGVPRSVFQHVEYSEEEKSDKVKLGRLNIDLDFFKRLNHSEKSRYIGRGHYLSDEQFKYLLDSNFLDLVNQHINTGIPLSSKKINLIKNNNQLMKTVKRNFLIRMEKKDEFDDLDEEDYDELDNGYYEILRIFNSQEVEKYLKLVKGQTVSYEVLDIFKDIDKDLVHNYLINKFDSGNMSIDDFIASDVDLIVSNYEKLNNYNKNTLLNYLTDHSDHSNNLNDWKTLLNKVLEDQNFRTLRSYITIPDSYFIKLMKDNDFDFFNKIYNHGVTFKNMAINTLERFIDAYLKKSMFIDNEKFFKNIFYNMLKDNMIKSHRQVFQIIKDFVIMTDNYDLFKYLELDYKIILDLFKKHQKESIILNKLFSDDFEKKHPDVLKDLKSEIFYYELDKDKDMSEFLSSFGIEFNF